MPTATGDSNSTVKPRVVVTGASGFIGRHLVPLLLEDHDVAVIGRPGSTLVALGEDAGRVHHITDNGDVDTLCADLITWKPELCIHLATLYLNATKPADVVPLVESNVAFGSRVAHAFAAAGGSTFVYTSTFSQHADGEAYKPTLLYAAMKEAFADILRFYALAHFSVIDLQLFDTFGPNDPRMKIWNLLMKAASTGETLDTTEGQQILSPIHVSDVARAIQHATNLSTGAEPRYLEYRVNGPMPVRLRDAVELFEKANDIAIPMNWGARPYSGNEMFELWQYAEPLPGWSPQVSLEDGFRELWQSYTDSEENR